MEKWSIKGKTVLITGATSGIGLAAAQELSEDGARIVLATSNLEKGKITAKKIFEFSGNKKIEIMECNLASFQSIKLFTDKFKAFNHRLDVLINNAGIWEPNFVKTRDGFESNFAVNYLAPFLLTLLLEDLIVKSAPARIINTSSEAHKGVYLNFKNIQTREGRFSGFRAYGQSKLALTLFTKKLADDLRDKNVTVNSFHPGFVRTNIFSRLGSVKSFVIGRFMLSPKQGAKTLVYLATSPEVGESTGEYYIRKKLARPSIEANNVEAEEILWEKSLDFVKKFYTPNETKVNKQKK
jgi:NAD(P)-dependent dehydrogenase (short-subunit alcohol dehydrogenase family)